AQVISLKEAIITFCIQERNAPCLTESAKASDSLRTMEAVVKEADTMRSVLEGFNKDAAEAGRMIKQALEAFRQTKDRDGLRTTVRQIQIVITRLSNDQHVLDLLKDNAAEAMLIRERKGFENVFDLKELSDEEIAFKLKKEQMFFLVLVRASTLMIRQMEEFLEKHHIGVG
ncbi:MAG: hypothetical protein JW938_04125, partial [Candidatus Omnitrophica bacterium]|nr:hypothetical protein [Candidatus Omnitrophota bacterium]